ncbi:hypothetical protein P154DRAFT_343108 [Amniculicola lignicola CBS 123094]|uniref:Uncharacterized protein n=1 Tax=Amniculicola lignicola CBS 123094 TaxID=1392246 RepID=A0A6A5W1E4_9PLEO|nr:hypothetical protein P154DRAFT_343108 [Amniculicola lignicola CBS 123094]
MNPSQVLSSISAILAIGTALLSTQYDLRAGSHGIAGGGDGVSGTTGSCTNLLGAFTRWCGGSTANSSRIFWTLDRGIVQMFQGTARRGKHDTHIPESLSDPSPLTAFAGWLIVALVISITLEVSSRNRLHGIGLPCSMFFAIMLGFFECATLAAYF